MSILNIEKYAIFIIYLYGYFLKICPKLRGCSRNLIIVNPLRKISQGLIGGKTIVTIPFDA
jgi:hypothetical protein